MNKSRIVAGIMSGTSLDGIDSAVVSIKRVKNGIRWKLLGHTQIKYPSAVMEALRRNSSPSESSIEEINDLNQLLPRYYSDAVKRAARKTGIPLTKIDLIGCHGQTLYHRPQPEKRLGKKFRATLQIGDPSTLSVLTGIPVIGNFRAADMAAGGEGAPLVPYADYLLFASKNKSRLIINIGGIANLTYLPKNRSENDVIAFDTGPGNIVIDALMRLFYNLPFDRNGAHAMRGNVNERLIKQLITHPYLFKKPPKSTGREEFGEGFIKKLIRRGPKGCSRLDLIATLTEFTAWSIFYGYVSIIRKRGDVNEVILSGGGAKNRYLKRVLSEYFSETPVVTSKVYGIPVEAKEALSFALLANETFDGLPGNLPSVTGAKRRVPLGVIAR